MKHVVSFSTGLSSAITVERVIERYGRENTIIVFMDTKIEDDDNYRFMDDCRSRWGEIIVLADGRDPYQVARDAQIIPNNKIAPCTFALKIKLFVRYVESIKDEFVIHIGYDYSEVHRCEATTRNYGARGWKVDYPLLWKPIEFRPYSQVCRDDWGIEPPRMYAMGYSHANCGGKCVKQGWGDWLRTLINFPERYAAAEQWECEMRNHPVRKDYAILKDQSGGMVRPKTLESLRLDYEARNNAQMSLTSFDAESVCFTCGVGDMFDSAPFAARRSDNK